MGAGGIATTDSTAGTGGAARLSLVASVGDCADRCRTTFQMTKPTAHRIIIAIIAELAEKAGAVDAVLMINKILLHFQSGLAVAKG